ncbi:MAG: CopG family transcriptional regulator [Vulcanimicrobiota bacterium]
MSKRTTLTLDDDVALQLEREARESGLSFKEVVNRAIRAGLSRRVRQQKPFIVQARPLGLRPGLSYDDIEELLEVGEGADHR